MIHSIGQNHIHMYMYVRTMVFRMNWAISFIFHFAFFRFSNFSFKLQWSSSLMNYNISPELAVVALFGDRSERRLLIFLLDHIAAEIWPAEMKSRGGNSLICWRLTLDVLISFKCLIVGWIVAQWVFRLLCETRSWLNHMEDMFPSMTNLQFKWGQRAEQIVGRDVSQ